MGKTTQKELLLQSDMLKGLCEQGFFATKTSDRFKAGRPDVRMSRADVGQLDVELKYSLCDFSREEDTGMTKLQWLKLVGKKEGMNPHGMPAVCLVYSEPLDLFFVTTLLRDALPPPARCVMKLPKPLIVDGAELVKTARSYLHGLGYTYP